MGLLRGRLLLVVLLVLCLLTSTTSSSSVDSTAMAGTLSSSSTAAPADDKNASTTTSGSSSAAAEGTAEVLDEREKEEDEDISSSTSTTTTTTATSTTTSPIALEAAGTDDYFSPSASSTMKGVVVDAALDAEEEAAASAMEDSRMTMDELLLLESSSVWVSEEEEDQGGALPPFSPSDWLITPTTTSTTSTSGIDWSTIDYDRAMIGAPGNKVPDAIGGMTTTTNISPYTNISLIPVEELGRLIGEKLMNTSLSSKARIIYDQASDKAYFDPTGVVSLEDIREGSSSSKEVVEVQKRKGTSTWCTCTRCFWAREQRLGCRWEVEENGKRARRCAYTNYWKKSCTNSVINKCGSCHERFDMTATCSCVKRCSKHHKHVARCKAVDSTPTTTTGDDDATAANVTVVDNYGNSSLTCYDIIDRYTTTSTTSTSDLATMDALTVWDTNLSTSYYTPGPIHTNTTTSKKKKQSWWDTLLKRGKGRRSPSSSTTNNRSFIPPPVEVNWSLIPFDLSTIDNDGYYLPTTTPSPPLHEVSIYTPLSHFDPQELEFLLSSNSTNKTSTTIATPATAVLVLDLESSRFYIDMTGTLTVDEIREGLPWWYTGPKPLVYNWRATTCTRCLWRRYTYQQCGWYNYERRCRERVAWKRAGCTIRPVTSCSSCQQIKGYSSTCNGQCYMKKLPCRQCKQRCPNGYNNTTPGRPSSCFETTSSYTTGGAKPVTSADSKKKSTQRYSSFSPFAPDTNNTKAPVQDSVSTTRAAALPITSSGKAPTKSADTTTGSTSATFTTATTTSADDATSSSTTSTPSTPTTPDTASTTTPTTDSSTTSTTTATTSDSTTATTTTTTSPKEEGKATILSSPDTTTTATDSSSTAPATTTTTSGDTTIATITTDSTSLGEKTATTSVTGATTSDPTSSTAGTTATTTVSSSDTSKVTTAASGSSSSGSSNDGNHHNVSPRAYGHKDPRKYPHRQYNSNNQQGRSTTTNDYQQHQAFLDDDDTPPTTTSTKGSSSTVRTLLLLSLGLAVIAALAKLLQRRLRRSQSFLPVNYLDTEHGNAEHQAQLLGVSLAWGKQGRYRV